MMRSPPIVIVTFALPKVIELDPVETIVRLPATDVRLPPKAALFPVCDGQFHVKWPNDWLSPLGGLELLVFPMISQVEAAFQVAVGIVPADVKLCWYLPPEPKVSVPVDPVIAVLALLTTVPETVVLGVVPVVTFQVTPELTVSVPAMLPVVLVPA
jgi:hypothetical protein